VGTFLNKVQEREFHVSGRLINFQALKRTGSRDSIVYKILDEPTASTIESPTTLNEPITSEYT
jgi:hypothetical protein